MLNLDLLTLKRQPILPDPIDNIEYPQHAIPHADAGGGPVPESHLPALPWAPEQEGQGKHLSWHKQGHCPEMGSPGPSVGCTRTSRESLWLKQHHFLQNLWASVSSSRKREWQQYLLRAVAWPKGAATSEVIRLQCLVHSQYYGGVHLVIIFQHHIMSCMMAAKRCPKSNLWMLPYKVKEWILPHMAKDVKS